MNQKGQTNFFFFARPESVFSTQSRKMIGWALKLLTEPGSSRWLNNVQVTDAASVKLASWLAQHHLPSRQAGIVAHPGHVRKFVFTCQIGELVSSAAGFVFLCSFYLFIYFFYLNTPSECARQRFICHDSDCELFLVSSFFWLSDAFCSEFK